MAELFKKVLYTGVGLVANTAEKVQNTIDELVKKGSLNEDEGKKVVDDLLETIETRKEDFEEKVRSIITETVNAVKLPSLKEYNGLMKRLKNIEAKLEEQNDNVMVGK